MPKLFDILEMKPKRPYALFLDTGCSAIPIRTLNIARFVMNVMLASGGYPWTVIEDEDRDAYLDALECASVDHDTLPFANFVATRVN